MARNFNEGLEESLTSNSIVVEQPIYPVYDDVENYTLPEEPSVEAPQAPVETSEQFKSFSLNRRNPSTQSGFTIKDNSSAFVTPRVIQTERSNTGPIPIQERAINNLEALKRERSKSGDRLKGSALKRKTDEIVNSLKDRMVNMSVQTTLL